MASGTINGTTSSQYCICKIEWTSTKDEGNNQSTVTAQLYLQRTNNYNTYGSGWSFVISIGGKTTTVAPGYKEVKRDWLHMGTATVTVPHDDNGSKSITISATGGCPGTSVTSLNCSEAVTLDDIPRASSITSVSDVTLGDKCSVTWTPKAASFLYRLKFTIGNWSQWTTFIPPNRTSAYTYTGLAIPLDAAWQIPTGTTGTMTVTLYTYPSSNATHIEPTSTKTFTVKVPPSTLPTVSMKSVVPVNSLPSAFDGLFVQGYSKVKATMFAETQYGSSIRYYDFTVEGKTYGEDEGYTSAYIANSGLISVVGHAVDSRGYGGYADAKINVIPYSQPKVQNVTVQRCDADGKPSDSGTYLNITAKRVYSKVESDGKQKNFCSIRYRYKSEHGAYGSWVTILAEDNTSTDEITTNALLAGALAVDATYLVQVSVVDTIGNDTYTTVTLPTEKVYWHRDGARRSLTFGGYIEEDNTFAIAPDIAFKPKGGIAKISLYDNLNFNELIYLTGYYSGSTAPSAANCANYPADKTGVLDVTSHMVQNKTTGAWWGFAWQIYRTYDGDIYARSYYSAEGWKPWKQVQMV